MNEFIKFSLLSLFCPSQLLILFLKFMTTWREGHCLCFMGRSVVQGSSALELSAPRLSACHRCDSRGSRLTRVKNLIVVCGTVSGRSSGVFSGYSGFLPPSKIIIRLQSISKFQNKSDLYLRSSKNNFPSVIAELAIRTTCQ